MSLDIEIQLASCAKTIPHPAQIKSWVNAVVPRQYKSVELCIKIVDEAESAELNKNYRGKAKSTNVLSFPVDKHPLFDHYILGDIVICAPVVNKEAHKANKNILAHWAHMVVHGTLHLLGYDHQTNEQALVMEGLEVDLLQKIGFDSPYI